MKWWQQANENMAAPWRPTGEETPADMLQSGETSKEGRKNSKSCLPVSHPSVATGSLLTAFLWVAADIKT